MEIKIIHAADFHIDSPFDSLPEEKSKQMRREMRSLIGRIADLAEQEGTDVVLLSGDLFDSDVSYYETAETLVEAFSRMKAEVFIAPGNHDYYCRKSPYRYAKFPENVHIFNSPTITSFEFPEKSYRVYGAGFHTPLSEPMLKGFQAKEGLVNLMVMHGDTTGDSYNHIDEEDIAASKLDYLALGHIHTFSGILKADTTTYAYPGCPAGRGFDEQGQKGVIVGTVSDTGTSLRFEPLGAREYRTIAIDMTGFADAKSALEYLLPEHTERDICRITFTGEFDGVINPEALAETFKDRFFHVSFRDETYLPVGIWNGVGENSLRGVFLEKLHDAYASTEDEKLKKLLQAAARYGLASLDRREEWRP